MKQLVLTFIALTLAIASQAQVSVHLGATTTYNATFVLDKGLSEDPRYSSQMTYNWAPIGFNFGIDFTKGFGLSLEAIQAKQGQIYEVIGLVNNLKQAVGKRNIDLEYLQIPMFFRFLGKGNGGARANFNLGPQLSLLTDAKEIMNYAASTQTFPEGSTLPEGASNIINNADGTITADLPAVNAQEILSKKANDFRNTEFSIAGAFGLDIDLSKHLFLTTQIRAVYSLTDMRNGDVLDAIKNGSTSDIFGSRANLLIGAQLGLHYTFGTTRSFKFK